MKNFDIDVSADGKTLWVNDMYGCCIGRFSKIFGIDIHHTGKEQLKGTQQCLFCVPGAAGPEEWKIFQDEMLKHYGVTVPTHYITY